MSIPDTPDNQRGTVNPQVLLASVPHATLFTTVSLPPNVETVIVAVKAGSFSGAVSCIGSTTTIVYPGRALQTTAGPNTWLYWYFDVSEVLDATVLITLAGDSGNQWYVYGDAGVHITTDPSVAATIAAPGSAAPIDALLVGGTDGTDLRALRVDQRGVPYAGLTAPDLSTGDHPPVELLFAAQNLAAAGVVLGPAGAGKRYRVFAAQMTSTNAANQGYLYDTVSGTPFLGYVNAGGFQLQYLPSGLALSNNAGISLAVFAGAGGALCIVVYTLETI